jgi:hypothetical protein
MRNLRIADPDFESRVSSPLSDCLIQLDTTSSTRTVQQQPVSEPVSWGEQWSSGKQQISSRLALIEAELDRLASKGPEPPLLSVFDSENDSY